jgi:hypothetical protein
MASRFERAIRSAAEEVQAVGVAAIRAGQQVEPAVAVELRRLRTELAGASPLGDPAVGHLIVEAAGCVHRWVRVFRVVFPHIELITIKGAVQDL